MPKNFPWIADKIKDIQEQIVALSKNEKVVIIDGSKISTSIKFQNSRLNCLKWALSADEKQIINGIFKYRVTAEPATSRIEAGKSLVGVPDEAVEAQAYLELLEYAIGIRT